MKTCCVAAVLLAAGLSGTAAQAAVAVTVNTDVTAGMTGFGAATPLLTWANAFGPGASWTTGVFGGAAIVGIVTAVDGVTGAQASGNLYVTNWIDGAGFDHGGGAGPDLAINGVENFTWAFAAPVSRIGFAIATGRGLLPGETSSSGTSFTLTTSTGEGGSFAIVDPGNGSVAWIDVIAATPFTSIAFTETGGDLTDQYFGNVVAGVVPDAIPEPAGWAMLVAGFGLTGAALRRRRGLPVVAS